MKQLVFIGGATSFTQYDAFLEYLRTREVDFDTFFTEKEVRWHTQLRSQLEGDYEVAIPRMPNGQNAQYNEWKIWFERLIPFLKDDVVLVGHSLGAMFLLVYLSQNVLPVRISQLLLAAPAVERDGLEGEDGGDFIVDHSLLGAVSDQCLDITLFHSKDDPVVPFSHAEKLQQVLPSVELVVFEDRDHFLQPEFPELIERVSSH